MIECETVTFVDFVTESVSSMLHEADTWSIITWSLSRMESASAAPLGRVAVHPVATLGSAHVVRAQAPLRGAQGAGFAHGASRGPREARERDPGPPSVSAQQPSRGTLAR